MRITRGELQHLCSGKRLLESTHFSEDLVFSFELCAAPLPAAAGPVQVSFEANRIMVTLSDQALLHWQADGEVGVYVTVPNGTPGGLAVILEKDFACLDRSHEENADAFVNPKAGAAC